MPQVRGHYRRDGWFGSHWVRPHYRRGRGYDVLVIVGGVLLVAFLLLLFARAT